MVSSAVPNRAIETALNDHIRLNNGFEVIGSLAGNTARAFVKSRLKVLLYLSPLENSRLVEIFEY